jgi:hypothetical protein
MARMRILFLAALLVIVSLLAPYHVSAGSGVGALQNAHVSYRWILTFDFAKHDDGLLTTTVRFLYPNGTYQDFERKTRVVCTPAGTGTVTVAGGAATFANNGYLDCDLPSIRDEIRAIYPPANPDNFQDPFWVRAISSINTGITTGPSGNPTFVHPDIVLFLPYNSALATGQARLVTDDQDTTSAAFTLGASNNVLANQRNWFDENGAISCTTRFQHQGVNLPITSYICPRGDEAMNFSLDASPFTIGYSAADGTYFKGALHHLDVDPVEWGDLD